MVRMMNEMNDFVYPKPVSELPYTFISSIANNMSMRSDNLVITNKYGHSMMFPVNVNGIVRDETGITYKISGQTEANSIYDLFRNFKGIEHGDGDIRGFLNCYLLSNTYDNKSLMDVISISISQERPVQINHSAYGTSTFGVRGRNIATVNLECRVELFKNYNVSVFIGNNNEI